MSWKSFDEVWEIEFTLAPPLNLVQWGTYYGAEQPPAAAEDANDIGF